MSPSEREANEAKIRFANLLVSLAESSDLKTMALGVKGRMPLGLIEDATLPKMLALAPAPRDCARFARLVGVLASNTWGTAPEPYEAVGYCRSALRESSGRSERDLT